MGMLLLETYGVSFALPAVQMYCTGVRYGRGMDLTEFDVLLMTTIDKARDQHQACTGGAVATAIHMSRSYVFQRLALLREAGYVTWTAMPGSLRVIPVAADAAEHAGLVGAGDATAGAVAFDEEHEAGTVTAAVAAGSVEVGADDVAPQLSAGEGIAADGDDVHHTSQAERSVSKAKSSASSSGTKAKRTRNR